MLITSSNHSTEAEMYVLPGTGGPITSSLVPSPRYPGRPVTASPGSSTPHISGCACLGAGLRDRKSLVMIFPDFKDVEAIVDVVADRVLEPALITVMVTVEGSLSFDLPRPVYGEGCLSLNDQVDKGEANRETAPRTRAHWAAITREFVPTRTL